MNCIAFCCRFSSAPSPPNKKKHNRTPYSQESTRLCLRLTGPCYLLSGKANHTPSMALANTLYQRMALYPNCRSSYQWFFSLYSPPQLLPRKMSLYIAITFNIANLSGHVKFFSRGDSWAETTTILPSSGGWENQKGRSPFSPPFIAAK